MNSFEKYEKMFSLEPYKDRSEMPIFPMCLTTWGSIAGITQKDLLASPQTWIEAMDISIEKIGKPDVAMPMCPGDTVFIMGLPSRIPGRELGDNELYQFVETPYFTDTSEYKKMLEMGWDAWTFKRSMDIHNMGPEELGARFAQVGKNQGYTIQSLIQRGMVPCFDGSAGEIFDSLSMARSMAEFTFDLFDCPGPIMDVINKFQPLQDEKAVKNAKATGATRIAMFAMRSSATFLSPDMFEEFVWPHMKQTITVLAQAGLRTILHADGNWLPMCKYFTELPKGCLNLELDGDTDIFAAYDILKGWQTIRGDVPATMFAYGTPDQISDYSEKLINMGMQGGFMLSSGCEIPMNAKLENIKAFMESL